MRKPMVTPIFPLVLALLAGCGKELSEQTTATSGITPINLPATISLEASIDSEGSRLPGTYTIPRDGDLYLPAHIDVSEGNALNHTIKIFLNKSGETWEFHCNYRGATANRYTLRGCFDLDDRDLGLSASNIELFTFPIDHGRVLEMTLQSSPARTRTTAHAVLRVDWK
jgi:hypothetical protein